ncbi:tetratricopeptide repeat protein [bacterium]|nr:tetratricopeptide repeat protein [bacterium]
MGRMHNTLLIAALLAAFTSPALAQQQPIYDRDGQVIYQPADPYQGRTQTTQTYPTQSYPAQPTYQGQGQVVQQQRAYPQQPSYQQAPPRVENNPFRGGGPAETYDYAKYSTFQELGRRNMAEGDIGQAEDRFAEALQINPFDPVSLNNLAVAKAEQGEYHTAKELLERAQRLDEGNQTIMANLSRLRGWLNTYAGNELGPRSRVTVPVARQVGSLPPAPPALWNPAAERQRIIIPSNERYERTYTPSAAYQTYTQPGSSIQTYELPNQRYPASSQ